MSAVKKITLVLIFVAFVGIIVHIYRKKYVETPIEVLLSKYDSKITKGLHPTICARYECDQDVEYLLGKKTASDGVNNPGNIKVTSIKWFGKNTPEGNKFETFTMMWEGYRAMMNILRNYYNKYGKKTLEDIIAKYAPSSDSNNPAQYANTVAQAIGIDSTDDASTVINGPKLQTLTKYMTKFEQGDNFFVNDADLLLAYESLKLPI